MRVLSLGWGVQSVTLAAMAALGDIAPIAFALHANTTHDSVEIYEFAAEFTQWLYSHGVSVVTITADSAKHPWWLEPHLNGYGTPPVFTYDPQTNRPGMLRRSCTQRWKISPMRRWLQTMREGEKITQLIGISLDEFQRMKPSDVAYIEHAYPLVDMRMTRANCVSWLAAHGLPIPPRSSCVFCPFHSLAEWRGVRNNPVYWEKATSIDETIRNARAPYIVYLHSSRIRLRDADLSTPSDNGQEPLWDDECERICGV